MKLIKKMVELLKPFRDLIVIVTLLAGTAYSAVNYFATSKQLATSEQQLKELQERLHNDALTRLSELQCFNQLNRELIRAELEEFRLSTLLQNNVANSERLRNSEDQAVRIMFENLSTTRATLTRKLAQVSQQKQELLLKLRDGNCPSTI